MASAVVLVELNIQMFLLPTISQCAGASTLPLRMHLVNLEHALNVYESRLSKLTTRRKRELLSFTDAYLIFLR